MSRLGITSHPSGPRSTREVRKIGMCYDLKQSVFVGVLKFRGQAGHI